MMWLGRKKMADLMKRLFPSALDTDIEVAHNRVLHELRSQLPQRFESFRFRAVPPAKIETLTPLEQVILRAIRLSPGGDFARDIFDRVEELDQKPVNRGSYYVVLEMLAERGLITKEIKPAPDRPVLRQHHGKRRKRPHARD